MKTGDSRFESDCHFCNKTSEQNSELLSYYAPTPDTMAEDSDWQGDSAMTDHIFYGECQ